MRIRKKYVIVISEISSTRQKKIFWSLNDGQNSLHWTSLILYELHLLYLIIRCTLLIKTLESFAIFVTDCLLSITETATPSFRIGRVHMLTLTVLNRICFFKLFNATHQILTTHLQFYMILTKRFCSYTCVLIIFMMKWNSFYYSYIWHFLNQGENFSIMWIHEQFMFSHQLKTFVDWINLSNGLHVTLFMKNHWLMSVFLREIIKQIWIFLYTYWNKNLCIQRKGMQLKLEIRVFTQYCQWKFSL